MDFSNTSYTTMFASCWGLLGAALLIASPIIMFKIKDHTDVADDLRFSDETAAEVSGLTVPGQSKEQSVPEKMSPAEFEKKSPSDA